MNKKKLIIFSAIGVVVVCVICLLVYVLSNTGKQEIVPDVTDLPQVAEGNAPAGKEPEIGVGPNGEVIPEPVIEEREHTDEAPAVFEGAQTDLAVVAESVTFAEYDNTIITGQQVREALSKFNNQRLALLVATRMVMDSTLALNQFDANIPSDTPTVGATGVKDARTTSGMDLSNQMTFINYNAILKGKDGKATMQFENGCFVAAEGLDVDGDQYVVNTNISRASAAGLPENIADYLHMRSYLVKDSEGTVIGLAFYSVV